jgi:hypothetical protein
VSVSRKHQGDIKETSKEMKDKSEVSANAFSRIFKAVSMRGSPLETLYLR